MACGTFGLLCGTFGVSCGAVGVLCSVSAGGLGSRLAGCGISEKCRSLVFMVGGRGGGSTLVREYGEKITLGYRGEKAGQRGEE